jgi:hypothetical protein
MAIRITKAQKTFLESHQIPLEKVLDANGMLEDEYKNKMAAEDYWVAVGVDSCPQGHKIKTKSGKCPVCTPSALGFSQRYRQPGWLYLAYSKAGGIVKFGYSTDVADRIKQLRGHGCGEQRDWIEVASFPAENAAELEDVIRRELKPYLVKLRYLSKPGQSREIYKCPLTKAVGVYLAYEASMRTDGPG